MARYSWSEDTGALARQGSAGMSTLRPGADRRVILAQRARQALVPRPQVQPLQRTHQQRLRGGQLRPLCCRAVVKHPRAGEHDGAGPDDLPRSPGEFVELRAGERRAVAGEGDGLLVVDVRVENDFQLADGSGRVVPVDLPPTATDRKSTRLNSSHANISYAVFCLKKKKTHHSFFLFFLYHPLHSITSILILLPYIFSTSFIPTFFYIFVSYSCHTSVLFCISPSTL